MKLACSVTASAAVVQTFLKTNATQAYKDLFSEHPQFFSYKETMKAAWYAFFNAFLKQNYTNNSEIIANLSVEDYKKIFTRLATWIPSMKHKSLSITEDQDKKVFFSYQFISGDQQLGAPFQCVLDGLGTKGDDKSIKTCLEQISAMNTQPISQR